jgi:hypothetical protein
MKGRAQENHLLLETILYASLVKLKMAYICKPTIQLKMVIAKAETAIKMITLFCKKCK